MDGVKEETAIWKKQMSEMRRSPNLPTVTVEPPPRPTFADCITLISPLYNLCKMLQLLQCRLHKSKQLEVATNC